MSPREAERPYWARVLLKLSGEALSGGAGQGVDPETVQGIANQVAAVVAGGVQIAIVVGGGNYVRGAEMEALGMDRSRADYMGMLGTIMNALALQDGLEQQGVAARVQTAIDMSQVAEPYIPGRAKRHLDKDRVVVFGGGTGLPYFSTDTTAVQRALEIGCQAVLMGKNGVRGVYNADPRQDPNAVFYPTLSYTQALKERLQVMDAAAFGLCSGHNLPMVVFDVLTAGNIVSAATGKVVGTLMTPETSLVPA